MPAFAGDKWRDVAGHDDEHKKMGAVRSSVHELAGCIPIVPLGSTIVICYTVNDTASQGTLVDFWKTARAEDYR